MTVKGTKTGTKQPDRLGNFIFQVRFGGFSLILTFLPSFLPPSLPPSPPLSLSPSLPLPLSISLSKKIVYSSLG